MANRYVAGVSPWTVIILIGVFFAVGYMAAWSIMQPDSSGSLFYGIVIVMFGYSLRKPMKWWAAYVAKKNEELKLQAKMEKQFGVSPDNAPTPKPKREKQTKHTFTSDDFDDKAQAMLVPMVKQARKAKAKITGEGLISEILKSFR